MNRAERRKLKKQVKGNLVVPKGVEVSDHSDAQFCWRHNLKLDNIDKPTERDKKLTESVRLKPFKSVDKNGMIIMGRSCSKCGNTIYAKTALQDPEKSSIIEKPEGKEYADIHLPNMPQYI